MGCTYCRITGHVDIHDSEIIRHRPVDILRDTIDLQDLGIRTDEHKTVEPDGQILTTQAFPGSSVLFKGSGCAITSGLQHLVTVSLILGAGRDSRVVDDNKDAPCRIDFRRH